MAPKPPQPLNLEVPAPPHAALASPRTPSALKGLNPLTAKVASVLSSSYADAEFRDSLALLDERHIQNNAETRRRLRLDIQKDVIDTNGQVIAEFGRVAEQLRRIGSTIDKINKDYGEMKAEIAAAHTATQPVLAEASTLMERRRHVETRRRLLDAFVGHFVLTEDEVAALTLTAEPVDERFFAALARSKKISKDCEILLGFEDNQALGLEIMEQTSRCIDLGFQKLYRWVQREFKNLNLENPQIGSAMSRALRVLAERPTLFQNCLDSFAEAREHILSDAFYTALTGTSSSSSTGSGGDGSTGSAAHSNRQGPPTVKPIELAAHDPLRYAGDMLAWTHSATVSEREALEALFVADGGELARGIQEGREHEVWRLASEGSSDETAAFDPVQALNALVDRDLSGVARILRQRMDQVIRGNEDAIVAYKLANLLNFYRLTFAKLLGGGGGGGGGRSGSSGTAMDDTQGLPTLADTLGRLETEALRYFRSLIRDRVAALQGEFGHAPADASPPDFFQEALEQLVSVMKTYDTSLTAPDSREADFEPILTEALDPFLAGCRSMAQRGAGAGTASVDSLVFTVNCLAAARATLVRFDFTAGRVAALQQEMDDISRTLAERQYAFFCEQSGMAELFAALSALQAASRNDVQQALELDLLQPPALAHTSQKLDDFLPSALMDALENLKLLQDPQLARKLTEEAAEQFCVRFEHIEALLDAVDRLLQEQDNARDPDAALRVIFPRTTVEIRVLLS